MAVSVLLVGVLMMTVLISMIPTQNVAAGASDKQFPSIKNFSRCVVETSKQIPEAKKLTPQGYQDWENTLNNILIGMKSIPKDPWTAAIELGLKLAKFIGSDAIWFVGVVQYCWPELK